MLDVFILAAEPPAQRVMIGWIIIGCGSVFLFVSGYIFGAYPEIESNSEIKSKPSMTFVVCGMIGCPAFIIGLIVAANIAVGVCFGMFLMFVPAVIGMGFGTLARKM